MIFSLFILAVVAIVLIARYNEDDHLFWQLLISFCAAFALTTTVMKLKNNEQHDNNSTTQVCPTQVSQDQGDVYYLPQFGLNATTLSHVTGVAPVSKDYMLGSSLNYYADSKITRKGRDQPVRVTNTHKPRDIRIVKSPWDTS